MRTSPHLPSADDAWPRSAAPAQQLAQYRLLRSLGRGGLGEVFEAQAPDGRAVAIKTFLLRDDDQGLLASAFVREANLGQRLNHPDIVKVLDSGCHQDHAYLVMEFVAGHDLRRHTRAGNLLPLQQVLQITQRVALALAAAHAIRVIHRDIKPDNVLVHGPSDTVKITDFGLARLGDAFRSRTGIIAGTPAYMSPEQLAEATIGPASDLYALGVVLFELLTGRLPHEATSLGELLLQVARHPAPPVDRFRPDLPAALVDLVAHLLHKKAPHRPQDGIAVADQLAALLADLPQGLNPGWPGGPKSRG